VPILLASALVAAVTTLIASRAAAAPTPCPTAATLPTASGSIRALQFSATRATSVDFALRSAAGGRHSLSINSNPLVVGGTVTLFANKFQGTLLGIQLTFTPDAPPADHVAGHDVYQRHHRTGLPGYHLATGANADADVELTLRCGYSSSKARVMRGMLRQQRHNARGLLDANALRRGPKDISGL
jgi:hypothetical protein